MQARRHARRFSSGSHAARGQRLFHRCAEALQGVFPAAARTPYQVVPLAHVDIDLVKPHETSLGWHTEVSSRRSRFCCWRARAR